MLVLDTIPALRAQHDKTWRSLHIAKTMKPSLSASDTELVRETLPGICTRSGGKGSPDCHKSNPIGKVEVSRKRYATTDGILLSSMVESITLTNLMSIVSADETREVVGDKPKAPATTIDPPYSSKIVSSDDHQEKITSHEHCKSDPVPHLWRFHHGSRPASSSVTGVSSGKSHQHSLGFDLASFSSLPALPTPRHLTKHHVDSDVSGDHLPTEGNRNFQQADDEDKLPLHSDETIHHSSDPEGFELNTLHQETHHIYHLSTNSNLDIETLAALSAERLFRKHVITNQTTSNRPEDMRIRQSLSSEEDSYGIEPGYIPRGKIQYSSLPSITSQPQSFTSISSSSVPVLSPTIQTELDDQIHGLQQDIDKRSDYSMYRQHHNLNTDVIIEEDVSQRESTATSLQSHANHHSSSSGRKYFSFRKILSMFSQRRQKNKIGGSGNYVPSGVSSPSSISGSGPTEDQNNPRYHGKPPSRSPIKHKYVMRPSYHAPPDISSAPVRPLSCSSPKITAAIAKKTSTMKSPVPKQESRPSSFDEDLHDTQQFYMDVSELRRGSLVKNNRPRSVRLKIPKRRFNGFVRCHSPDSRYEGGIVGTNDNHGKSGMWRIKRSLSADFQVGQQPQQQQSQLNGSGHNTAYSLLPGRPLQSRRTSGIPSSSTSSLAFPFGGAQQQPFKTHVVETSIIHTKSDDTSATFWNPYGQPERSRGQVNQYHILRDIGSGSFGRVVLVRNEISGVYHACKIISKAFLLKKYRWICGVPGGNQPPVTTGTSNTKMNAGRNGSCFEKNGASLQKDPKLAMIQREVAVLKKLSKHPNIVNLVEVLDDAKEDNIYMIFDLCEYGPVMNISFGQVAEPFSEEVARGYFRDIVLGLEYLHYKRVVHNDLKPENLLLTSDHVVQIADFGISHMFEDDDEEGLLHARNASPMFTPPEAFAAGSNPVNGRAADIWSLGITLYCFVHGRCPFENLSPIELSQQVLNDPLIMSETLSPALIDLLAGMLSKDPRTRLNIPKIKQHPWVTHYGADPMMSTEENCVFEEVTEEEVETAFKPAMVFVDKVFDLFRGRKKSAALTHHQQRPRSSQRSVRSQNPVEQTNNTANSRHSLTTRRASQNHHSRPHTVDHVPHTQPPIPLKSQGSYFSSSHSSSSPIPEHHPSPPHHHQDHHNSDPSIHASAMSIASTTVAYNERRSAIAKLFSRERSRSFAFHPDNDDLEYGRRPW